MTTHAAAAILDCTRDHVSKLLRAKRIRGTRWRAVSPFLSVVGNYWNDHLRSWSLECDHVAYERTLPESVDAAADALADQQEKEATHECR